MGRCVKINATELLADLAVHSLTLKEIGKVFVASVCYGQSNVFSPYIREVRQRAGKEWHDLRARVFERDDYTCRYCGERGGRLECDHVHPVSRGGRDNEDNLVTACFSCNRSKRDKTGEEWLS